jgi:hypothetical protein
MMWVDVAAIKLAPARAGSKLELEIVTPKPTGVGAAWRYSGRVMGLTIDLTETVTKYIADRGKAVHIAGPATAYRDCGSIVAPSACISPRGTLCISSRCDPWWAAPSFFG